MTDTATNRLERLFEIRDKQRMLKEKGNIIVRGRDLPLERNRQGLQHWYMHPDMEENCLQSLLVYVQELPPGGRSGKQKMQGGHIGVVWEGRGYTLVDGVRHDWEKHDVLNFPVRTAGMVIQHVNSDMNAPARLLLCEPNVIESLGVDRGCGFEQVEDAPD
jgi:gentisate 1,2-dioxygenase